MCFHPFKTAATLCIGLIFMTNVQAQLLTWNNTTGTPIPYFDIAGNWTPLSIPGATNQVIFNADATYQVWWDAMTSMTSPEVDSLTVENGNVTFRNVDGDTQHKLIIGGDSLMVSGASTSLTLSGVELESLNLALVRNGAAFNIDGSHAQGSTFTGNALVLNADVGDPASSFNVYAGGLANLESISILNGSTMNIAGSDSQVTVNSLTVFDGAINVSAGGFLNSTGFGQALGFQAGNVANGTVTGIGSRWDATSLVVGANGDATVDVNDGGQLNTDILTLGGAEGSNGRLNIQGIGSQANGALTIGSRGNGILEIREGGIYNDNSSSSIAQFAGSMGAVTVSGSGSQWNSEFGLVVGRAGEGSLIIDSGGVVTVGPSSSGSLTEIADGTDSVGSMIVSGIGSRFTTGGAIRVADAGSGSLVIEDGGEVTTRSVSIGRAENARGEVHVGGTSSTSESSLVVETQLTIGVNDSTGELNIGNNGRVSVGGLTQVFHSGQVDLNGGRFEFGRLDIHDFTRISGTSGELAGTTTNNGYTDVAAISGLQNPSLDFSDVVILNSGTLHGTASLGGSLDNTSSGEIQLFAGEQMRFSGSGNNAGEINNLGGLVRFEGTLNNNADAFTGGRGAFIANGGVVNNGVMAFSGTTDLIGDIQLNEGSVLVTSGTSRTTIFDDVGHNGLELRTSVNSETVIFGEASGAGAYTGGGSVFFEGDLRPGNSPAQVLFDVDVFLGTAANTLIELAGTDIGLFDQLMISGDFGIDGDLSVSLIDGFSLGANQHFLFADVGGTLFGQFDGLNEGDRVANFGGRDLFITYNGFDGNAGVGLFTAVPEPVSGAVVGMLLLALACRRGRI